MFLCSTLVNIMRVTWGKSDALPTTPTIKVACTLPVIKAVVTAECGYTLMSLL